MSDDTDLQALFNISESARIDRRADAEFRFEIEGLLKQAEDLRQKYLKQHKIHKYTGGTISLLAILCGSTGFGWFLLMEANLVKAVGCIILAITVPLLAQIWARLPIRRYTKAFKEEYLPQLAKTLGGFSYFPDRGISQKIIKKTGVVPPYTKYDAEDCFTGKYRDTRVIFSETRLYNKGAKQAVFDGLFVLMEVPHKVFTTHTIITADRVMAQEAATTRWHKLKQVPFKSHDVVMDRFVAFADKPDEAMTFLGDKLWKELYELDAKFGDGDLSAVLFRGKYVFMMIPHPENMFEASDLYVPVTSHNSMMKYKEEIEQLLELIDVFDIYAKGNIGQDNA